MNLDLRVERGKMKKDPESLALSFAACSRWRRTRLVRIKTRRERFGQWLWNKIKLNNLTSLAPSIDEAFIIYFQGLSIMFHFFYIHLHKNTNTCTHTHTNLHSLCLSLSSPATRQRIHWCLPPLRFSLLRLTLSISPLSVLLSPPTTSPPLPCDCIRGHRRRLRRRWRRPRRRRWRRATPGISCCEKMKAARRRRTRRGEGGEGGRRGKTDGVF